MIIPTHSSSEAANLNIVINQLGRLNDYDFKMPHRHDYFELFYFEKGGGQHLIDFVSFEIEDHSIHIVAPGQVHQMSRALDSEGYVILFELNAIEAPKVIEGFLFEHICLHANELCPVFKLERETIDAHVKAMQEALKCSQEQRNLFKLKVIHAIHFFCISSMETQVQLRGEINAEYLDFRKYLKQNYKTHKKVRYYAAMMRLTERSLNELVRKYSGKSVSELIFDELIMESKRLLRSGLSVKEVAYTLSFDDPSHFSKFFKSKVGSSPSSFHHLT